MDHREWPKNADATLGFITELKDSLQNCKYTIIKIVTYILLLCLQMELLNPLGFQ